MTSLIFERSKSNQATHNTAQPVNVLEQVPLWFLGVAAAVLLVNRVGYHLFATPLPDEAYYWLWGQHPDWSYYDHPPLQAWVQGLTSWAFGASKFALRLPAVISAVIFAGTLVFWARRFDATLSTKALITLVIAAFSSPLYFVFTGIVFNDHVLVALLSLASICAVLALNRVAETGRFNLPALYGAAVLIGLAGISKYNAALFAAGLFFCILIFPRFRPALKSPHLYLAGVLCALCLAPVVWWNLTHDAASFQYNLSDRLDDDQGVANVLGRLAAFLLLMVLGLSPFLVPPAFAALRRSPIPVAWVDDWRKIGATLMLVSTLFCVVLTTRTHVLFYWNIVAFVAILPFALLTFRHRRTLMAHIAYGMVAISLININFTVLPLSALAGTPDHESAIPFGWPKLTRVAERLERKHDVDFVVTSDYRTAAILAFETGNTDVEVIADRISQFTLWFDQDARAGQTALILTSRWHPMSAKISDRFESINRVNQQKIQRFGYPMTSYTFYIGKGYIPDVPQ